MEEPIFFFELCQTFLKTNFIGVQLLYNVVLVSAIQQTESVICVCICICIYIYIPFFVFPSHLGHHRALSFLCSTVGSH